MITETEKLARRNQERTKRLQLAFKRSGLSKREFQRQLEFWEVPGTSRANVDRYLSGEVGKPPVDFYITAARLLDVPLPWLLGMTDEATEEAIAAEEADKQEGIRKVLAGISPRTRERLPRI